jgi:hypothetical protein
LRPGAHRVEVGSDGFLPLTRDVSIVRGAHEVVPIQLERDPRAALTFSEAEAARQEWLRRGGSTLAYEVRGQGIFMIAPHRTLKAGSTVVGSSPEGGPYSADGTIASRDFGGGGAGGVGIRLSFLYLVLPDPSSGRGTWSAIRIGAGADVNLGYWYTATQLVGSGPSDPPENHQRTTTYRTGVWDTGWMFNIPVTLGYQLGLGSFKGTEWHGAALGIAYTPSLSVLKPKDLDGTSFVNLAGFEVSVDFHDHPMRSSRTSSYGKVFVYVLPPVGDSSLIVSIGGGAAWY